ncbi:WXG100 family type VII secretion target [Amycolatopsis panacis]|nr:WXG100 family type VII secretion target [Amycolatopsis panacis]
MAQPSWEDIQKVLDDPAVPHDQKSKLMSACMFNGMTIPKEDAAKYSHAYVSTKEINYAFGPPSIEDTYNEAKQAGDQASYNDDEHKKAVDEGKKKLDEKKPPAPDDTSGTKTSDELLDTAKPALKLFETFGSLFKDLPDDCKGNTTELKMDEITKRFDEQRAISFEHFMKDATHFKTGADTVEEAIKDTGSTLTTLMQTWKGAAADAAWDHYNDDLVPKATKLQQSLGNAAEATRTTASTVFSLVQTKARQIIELYNKNLLVACADFPMAKLVVKVAKGSDVSDDDLAAIAGWMDANFHTNLYQTLNDRGCCDKTDMKKEGQKLAKQWIQQHFNPVMWDRIYQQGFVKSCDDAKEFTDKAYDELDKVLGKVKNEFGKVGDHGSSGGTGGSGGGHGGGGRGGGGYGGGGHGGDHGGQGDRYDGPGGPNDHGGGQGGGVPDTNLPGGGTGGGSGSGGTGGGSGGGTGGGAPPPAPPPVPDIDLPQGNPPGGSGGGSGPGAGGGAPPPVPDTNLPGGGTGDGTGGSGGGAPIPPPVPDTNLPPGGSPGGGTGGGPPVPPPVPDTNLPPGDDPAGQGGDHPGDGKDGDGDGDGDGKDGGKPGEDGGGGSSGGDPTGEHDDGEGGDEDQETLKVEQKGKTFEMTEPGDDGRMDIKVGDGEGDPKDFTLDWSSGDENGSGDETGGAQDGGHGGGDGPDGGHTYHPGPDGKIHIQDGDLKITAERPDGPDGPTKVTVDDGSGTPTTYTLGEHHSAHDGSHPGDTGPAHDGSPKNDEPSGHGEPSKHEFSKHGETGGPSHEGMPGDTSPSPIGGARGIPEPVDTTPLAEDLRPFDGTRMPDPAGDPSPVHPVEHGVPAGGTGPEHGPSLGDTPLQHGSPAGGTLPEHGSPPGGTLPGHGPSLGDTPLQHGSPAGGALPEHGTPLGDTPSSAGPHHTGAPGVAPTDTHFAGAPAGPQLGTPTTSGGLPGVPDSGTPEAGSQQPGATPSGSPGHPMGGGMQMGGMGGSGGGGGGGGEDHDRSRTYRVEGNGLFEPSVASGRRITGSLDDDDELSPVHRARK